ncbi:MAG: hypothetical protein K2X11_04685 [Acetobacteraceae bacterium]|nr:hypothetical protein [Acetobacteraceae bacterium]
MKPAVLAALLTLAGCGAVDTSRGASGFPDAPWGQPGFRTGVMNTDGTITLNRERPSGTFRPNY